jgi:HK97 family phage major capsid protein
MPLLDDLRQRRATAREAADAILERAAAETRDLAAAELADYQAHVVEQREADDAIEAERDRELAELRAAATRRPAGPAVPREPVLTREQSVEQWAQQRGMFEPPAAGERAPSFDRYLRGIVTGNWDGAEQERALSEGTLTAGGHLVPTPLSARVIDLARNATQVFRAGAITVPMTAQTLKLARLTSEGTPAWKSENAAISAADMVFDSVTFTARTMVRLVQLSVELFEDADPSSEDVIARSFAARWPLSWTESPCAGPARRPSRAAC